MAEEDGVADDRLDYVFTQLQINFKNVPEERFAAFASSESNLGVLYDFLDSDCQAVFITEATRGNLSVSKQAPGQIKNGQQFMYIIKIEVSFRLFLFGLLQYEGLVLQGRGPVNSINEEVLTRVVYILRISNSRARFQKTSTAMRYCSGTCLLMPFPTCLS
mgnify:CR=1 FL=1